MPASEARQYERVCKERFDEGSAERKEILELLRGKGDSPGLVGLISRHDEHINDLRSTFYGKPDGVVSTVERLSLNGQNRKTEEQERRAFRRAVICRLLTTAIIALAALLLGLYRGQPSPADSGRNNAACRHRRRG